MALQNVLPVILHPTLVTLERSNNKVNHKRVVFLPEAKVTTQMILHVPFSPEADTTFIQAWIRSSIRVDQHVSLEVLLFTKAFIAARNGALKRHCHVVGFHVFLILILPVKRDPTFIAAVYIFCLHCKEFLYRWAVIRFLSLDFNFIQTARLCLIWQN